MRGPCECIECLTYEGQHLGINACPELKLRTLLRAMTKRLREVEAECSDLRARIAEMGGNP